jgi:proteasome lid subunit RPN8/RPN11
LTKTAESVNIGTESGAVSETEAKKKDNPTSEFSVEWNTVDTKKYADAFREIESKPQVSKELASSSRAILEHRDGTNYEDYYLIDSRTGKVEATVVNSEAEAGIKYTKEVEDALKADDGKRYISVHNHPSSSPPSAADLNALRRNTRVDYGVIAGHNGTVIKYTAPNADIDEKYFIDLQKIYTAQGYNPFTAQIKALEDLQKTYKFKMEVFENES